MAARPTACPCKSCKPKSDLSDSGSDSVEAMCKTHRARTSAQLAAESALNATRYAVLSDDDEDKEVEDGLRAGEPFAGERAAGELLLVERVRRGVAMVMVARLHTLTTSRGLPLCQIPSTLFLHRDYFALLYSLL